MTDTQSDEAAAFYWPKEKEDKSAVVMPGDNVEMECEIYHPLAVDPGQRFNVRLHLISNLCDD